MGKNKDDLNLSILVGRLIKDPELYFTANGSSLCKFDVAVEYNFEDLDGEAGGINLVTINTYNRVADACFQYLKKNSKVRVRGELKKNSWTASDGTIEQKFNIEAVRIYYRTKI